MSSSQCSVAVIKPMPTIAVHVGITLLCGVCNNIGGSYK